MREHYWTTYTNLEYKLRYYKYFQKSCNCRHNVISIACLLGSLACISSLKIWALIPVVWSAIIVILQILQALTPYILKNDLALSSKLIATPLSNMLVDMRHEWLLIESSIYSDDEIRDLIYKFETQYSDMVSLFFPGTFLPESKHIQSKAEADWIQYFEVTYPNSKEVK